MTKLFQRLFTTLCGLGATYSAIFVPAAPPTNASLAATTSSAEIVFANDSIIAINWTAPASTAGPVYVEFGVSGMPAASASNGFMLPVNWPMEFDFGGLYDRIRIYNAGSTAALYSILELVRS